MRNDLFLKGIGKKVRAARKAKNVSLEKLAEMSGIDISNLSFLENGRRNPHILTLKSISDVLNVPLYDLI